MKTIQIFIAISLFFSSFSSGQIEIKVAESNETFETGSHNSLTVNIYQADEKEVEKSWKKLMKDYDAKTSVKKEIFADDASIKDMSSNTVDIYAKIKKEGEDIIKLSVAFDLGGAYLSSSQHPTQYNVAKKIIYNFAVEATKEAIRGMQKEAEKELKKREDESKDLVKTNEDLHKQIEDYKKKITEAEKSIETNIKDQETKQKEIEDQKKVIEEIINKEKAVK